MGRAVLQEGHERWDDLASDEAVYLAKLVNHRPASGSFCQSYREGRVCLWFRLILVADDRPTAKADEISLVFYRAGGIENHLLRHSPAFPAIELKALRSGNGEIQLPVLINAVEIVEEGQKLPVPSVVWLHRFDKSLGRWVNEFDLEEAAGWGGVAFLASLPEFVGVNEDRKLDALELAIQERLAETDCKLVGNVVEGGSHVVDAIPEHQRQLGRGMPGDLRPQDMLSGLRICLQNRTAVSFQPPLGNFIQAVSVNQPSVELH